MGQGQTLRITLLLTAFGKSFLGFLFATGILVILCDTYCFFQANDPAISTEGCVQDGKIHKFGTNWRTEDCHRCNCSWHGLSCCSIFIEPGDYDRETCVSIFNKNTCRYTVVEKANPSKTCVVYSWVG
ncbi:hypothetical protein Y1Q_0001779 [Alligator mississippiensis]|uniref:Beta-microseminoprotein n=1 Tax=Alligator mississippiensis TaxID=8496 RepID=A0A151MKU9_ALLMI|nr:hypothetical protein Y1Q_0001779 [Alligator mississippiensis]